MFKRLFSAALIFGVAAIGPPALAQTAIPCGNHKVITDQLKARFSEARVGAGLQTSDTLMELWSSDETGSWTVLIIRPNGVACVVASGEHWYSFPETEAKGTAS